MHQSTRLCSRDCRHRSRSQCANHLHRFTCRCSQSARRCSLSRTGQHSPCGIMVLMPIPRSCNYRTGSPDPLGFCFVCYCRKCIRKSLGLSKSHRKLNSFCMRLLRDQSIVHLDTSRLRYVVSSRRYRFGIELTSYTKCIRKVGIVCR